MYRHSEWPPSLDLVRAEPAPLEAELWSRTMTVHAHRPPRGARSLPKRILAAVSIALTIFATTSLGGGAWIYVKAHLAQVLLRAAWERTVLTGDASRPWPWADMAPVARLRIREKGAIVLSGVSGRSLAFAPGHLGGSALPGENGNCVISAHRDTDFAVLRRLQVDDEIDLETPRGEVFHYRVTGTRVVHQSDTSVLRDREGATLTLITCWPFEAVTGGATERFVVFADLER